MRQYLIQIVGQDQINMANTNRDNPICVEKPDWDLIHSPKSQVIPCNHDEIEDNERKSISHVHVKAYFLIALFQMHSA